MLDISNWNSNKDFHKAYFDKIKLVTKLTLKETIGGALQKIPSHKDISFIPYRYDFISGTSIIEEEE